MALSDLEKEVWDGDYQNSLFCLNQCMWAFIRAEQYENASKVYWTWKRVGDDYIDFRLTEYCSEGRRVIREAYKVLGYNPYKDDDLKRLGDGKDE